MREGVLRHAMRKITSKQGTPCALALLLLLAWFPPDLRAQRALKFSPKVMEVLNMPPLEIKNENDDAPLLRLKKRAVQCRVERSQGTVRPVQTRPDAAT